jgi:hypothetical protein
MTTEHSIHALIIGIVIALGTGFLGGYLAHQDQVPYYNPQPDAAKVAEENTRACYGLLAEALKPKEQGVAH